jgi:serine/threonine-protein kinase RsbW
MGIRYGCLKMSPDEKSFSTKNDLSMQPLIVPGKLDSLEKIRKYTLEVTRLAGLEKPRAYKLSLAVDEIATNIINYGYTESGKDGNISVEVDFTGDSVIITLDDTAEFYDPTVKSPPDPDKFDQPLGERIMGGWGVYLAITGVDQFRYQRLKDHNRNIFIMHRGTA